MKMYHDRDWLYKQYVVDKRTICAMAEVASCSIGTIHRWLHKHDIPIRSNTPIQERFWSKISTQGNNGCWE